MTHKIGPQRKKKKESISNPHFLRFHLTPVGLAFLPQPHVPVLTMSNQYCDLTVLQSHQVAQRSICSWQMRDFKACSDQSSSLYFVHFHCGWVYSVGSLHKIPQVSSQLLTASSVDVHFRTWQQRELYQDAWCVCTQMQMSAGSCLCMSEDNFWG